MNKISIKFEAIKNTPEAIQTYFIKKSFWPKPSISWFLGPNLKSEFEVYSTKIHFKNVIVDIGQGLKLISFNRLTNFNDCCTTSWNLDLMVDVRVRNGCVFHRIFSFRNEALFTANGMTRQRLFQDRPWAFEEELSSFIRHWGVQRPPQWT